MIRKEMTGFEHAILSAADEVAHKGDMRKLLNDVGIRKKELNFRGLGEVFKDQDEQLLDPMTDSQFTGFLSAVFTPIDMTEYEIWQVSEAPDDGTMPAIGPNLRLIYENYEHKWPVTHDPPGIEETPEPSYARSRTHMDLLETRKEMALAEEEEDEEGPEEDEEDEDEEEEGDEEEEEDDEEEEEDDEEEEVEEDPENDLPYGKTASEMPFFRHHGDGLFKRYNEHEVDAFMRMLSIRPFKNWRDRSTYHCKLLCARFPCREGRTAHVRGRGAADGPGVPSARRGGATRARAEPC